MFLSKLLSGRNNLNKPKQELLTDAWTSVQRYYETASDPLKDAIELTPIPTCLQNIVKLIQSEEFDYQRANDNLATGPCLEYLLQTRVLEELVEFAKVDTPYGMRVHCLRFFTSLITNVHAQILPERAVHVPLQKIIQSCHRLISHHHEQLAQGLECSEERHSAIAELSLELVRLIHAVFSHFKGSNAALMDLFFERGWCRGLGEKVWRNTGKDAKSRHRRRESVDDKIAWNVFLMPRFDMFTYLLDYMNIPGETSEIAREAMLFALRLLNGDPEYVCYVVEYSGLCEVMAERLALLFVHLPKTIGSFTVSPTSRPVPVRPPSRRVHFSVPAVVATNNLAVAASAHHSFIKKRRKRSPFDADFVRSLEMMADGERIVDEFYSFWELLNDMARVGEKRLTTALTAQLTTTFWHPVICTALSSTYPELAIATTKYTTEMIKSLTDQMLLQSFLVILIGERGGVGKDLEPEVRQIPTSEQEKEPVEEEVEEAAAEEAKDKEEQDSSPKESAANQEETTLRRLLISRMNQEPELLALCTLRLFDTILETYNQFAVYNLVLRNYLDITPDGKYVDEVQEQKKSETFDGNEDKSVTSHDRGDDEVSNADELDTPVAPATNKENQKDPKVRWVVERILSLLPLEDELERMKTPPVSSLITSDHYGHHMRPSQDSMHEKSFSENDTRSFDGSVHSSTSGSASLMVPGNSYDDYFVEAQERLQYGLLARNFWVTPYPPVKTQLDRDRELEDLRGRPKRKSMAFTKQTLIEEDEPLEDETDGNEHVGKAEPKVEKAAEPKLEKAATAGHYEGLFLSVLFDEFAKILEASLERNLIITSILAKIVGIVDRRVEGVLCDLRAIRQGEDGTFYGGVWTLASGRGNRRSLYALLEQITFEALRRAQVVPNFETRISIAKRRGLTTAQIPSAPPKMKESKSLLRSGSGILSGRKSDITRRPSLSQLVFKGSMNQSDPVPPIPQPMPSMSTSVLSDKSKMSQNTIPPPLPSNNSTSTFFQNPRANFTPVTMTNPFAKLSNFVHSYIVLQEFCKEVAAAALVLHSTTFADRELTPMQQVEWLEESEYVSSSDKMKNRMSVMSVQEWRGVDDPDQEERSLEAMGLGGPVGGLVSSSQW
ncbi:Retinoic acid induced 16-like protein-domain-containing protein [Umbelopsis sp. AD052]|nr:Retinoic acid induced 16-like protein-domain-containing protein [Umbelopsis sp. AD052]